MKTLLALLMTTMFLCANAAENVVPTVTPALFRPDDQITVTYDVTGTPLASLTNAWAWVWIPGATAINARYNVNPAGSSADNAKFTKSVVGGRTLFSITFKPSDFFSSSIASQTRMGILIKGNDWSNGQSIDHLMNFWDGSFQIALTSPTARPVFVSTGNKITITAEAPIAANWELFINNVSVNTKASATAYSFEHTVAETSGSGTVRLVATNGANSSEQSFQYLISAGSPVQARPAGIISGINYTNGDPTKVTLCLLAPGKSSVYVRGDFSNWDVLGQNLMKRDGEYFWIELSGLTSGQEYAFQYLIDENLYVADPYSDKILDPDDQYIPATSYPNLKTFPAKALQADWYKNRLSVFQTNQQAYAWQVNNFTKPAKEKLAVYELLVRDFFANGQRNYQNLIDTIGYFKRLGINAIELMPIMEFNGNESWGYNPTFMFAPDKYYGTKNKLKEFIDVCHQNGIAVILDIAMNHQDLPGTYVMEDFDFTAYKPKATNKWFNPDARHPFNVFYDMNHESAYTKHYLDTVNHYWLNEYKVDGFRFDLSKGFTQTNNPNNVDAWSQRDNSRIAILKRMADEIWSHTPEAYVILEHLSVNEEEKILAEYRSEEGKGMMLWGKMTDQYNQNTMGFADNSNITNVLHTGPGRNWSVPHLVGYMESHDEERLMFKNLQYGNISGSYSVKDLQTALKRMQAANTVFYTLPGPKMLWQFGELGYEYSINYCENGTINNDCRISSKPVKWEYQDEAPRARLYDHTAEIIKLRNTYDVFTEGVATIEGGLSKQIVIRNSPYTATPANTDEMNVQIVTNFNLTSQPVVTNFPHTGTWYEFYSGSELQVTSVPAIVNVGPGEYKLFTDVKIPGSTLVTSAEEDNAFNIVLYPNPAGNVLSVEYPGEMRISSLALISVQGVRQYPERLSRESWNIAGAAKGLYIVEVKAGSKTLRKKIIKN